MHLQTFRVRPEICDIICESDSFESIMYTPPTYFVIFCIIIHGKNDECNGTDRSDAVLFFVLPVIMFALLVIQLYYVIWIVKYVEI